MAYKSPIPVNHNPTNILKKENIPSNPLKSPKKRGRKRKATSKSRSRKQLQAKKISKKPTMKDLTSSLRMECLRLADYIKQGSYRKASVF